MAAKTRRRSRKSNAGRPVLQKPNGVIAARVRNAGPERFGLVCIDPAKKRSRWMMANFLGEILVEPATLEQTSGHFRHAIARVNQAVEEYGIRDMIVVVERTGNYHEPARRAFARARFDTRVIHPFATKQFRQAESPGVKTDDKDLIAIHRGACCGFGLLELPLDEDHRQLRLLVRHRRDLVQKRSSLNCQIKEYLHRTMPGYAACFETLWTSKLALPIARATGTPAAVLQAGPEGLAGLLARHNVRFQARSLEKILVWARQAVEPEADAGLLTRIWSELLDDREAKSRQIADVERDAAALLVRTPYVLLLTIPGIHVVSAADLAGELGPIAHYAGANSITGRAGLFPSRYQSDETDRADGRLVRCANRRLRAALLRVADNLVKTNRHFAGLAATWRRQKVDERLIRVRIAKQFSRLLYAMVAGRQLVPHRCCHKREFLLKKLMDFHRQHATPLPQLMADLQAAVDQLPTKTSRGHEAQFLSEHLKRLHRRRSGPTPLGELLPAVLARIKVPGIQSSSSEDAVPDESTDG